LDEQDAQQLEQSIRENLPLPLQASAGDLARFLVEVTNKQLSEDQIRERVHNNPLLGQLVTSLSGQTLETEGAFIQFGKTGQMGDVSIRDIARGNIININLTTLERSARTWTVPVVVFGVLLMVALIAAGLVATSLLRPESSTATTATTVPTALISAPTSTTATESQTAPVSASNTPTTPSPQPTTLAETCFAPLVADLPQERIILLVVGETMHDVSYSVVSPTEPTPLVVQLIDKGKTLAVIRLIINRPSAITQVDGIMGSECNEVTTYRNADSVNGDDPLENNGHLEIILDGQPYVISPNYRATRLRFLAKEV
jgi:hypothetical protein